MKLIEKIIERLGSFSPMVIFVLLCIFYLKYFENQTPDPEPIKKEVKQVDQKPRTDTGMQLYWLFRD